MIDLFFDALIDSLKTVPLLLIIYIGIEILEYRFGDKIREKVQNAGKAGPVFGAIAGVLPQCGFSVVATALFTQRLLTIGTLLAVYLSTSDEAIPIILSQPDKVHLLLPLIGIKIIIALLVGYGVDLFFKKEEQKVKAHIELVESGHDSKNHHHETILNETACCGHSTSCISKKFDIKEIFWHPVVHTFNVFIFIFLVTLFINFIVFYIGEASIAEFFTKNIFWQPFLASIIGLIPNCAASVAITELFIKNIIGLGPAVAGLLASGGLGLLVLYREEKNKKTFFKVLILLYSFSALSGLIIQFFS